MMDILKISSEVRREIGERGSRSQIAEARSRTRAVAAGAGRIDESLKRGRSVAAATIRPTPAGCRNHPGRRFFPTRRRFRLAIPRSPTLWHWRPRSASHPFHANRFVIAFCDHLVRQDTYPSTPTLTVEREGPL